MAVSLAEALEHVDLETGRTYRFWVKDRWIELRVLPPPAGPQPASVTEDDIRLDPWVEFPRPESASRVRGRPGFAPPPDIPDIPTDGDEA